MRCPCCIGGEITEANICDVCGVGIARGTEPPSRVKSGRRRRQDQDERRPYADYAATKEDKQ